MGVSYERGTHVTEALLPIGRPSTVLHCCRPITQSNFQTAPSQRQLLHRPRLTATSRTLSTPKYQTPHPTRQTPNPRFQTPNPKPQTSNPKPKTPNVKPHPKPQIPNTRTQTPDPNPQTLNPKPGIRNPKPQTPNPNPLTPHPKPQTPHPKPHTHKQGAGLLGRRGARAAPRRSCKSSTLHLFSLKNRDLIPVTRNPKPEI